MKDTVNIYWFRRDLRLDDNVGLFHALNTDHPVLPIFIFDIDILDKLPKNDARVTFIYEQLIKIDHQLKQKGSSLGIYYGKPIEVIAEIIQKFNVNAVFANDDYEPYAIKRDAKIEILLDSLDIKLNTIKDHVIFEKNEIVKQDGDPYKVYTPYMKKWKERFKSMELKSFKSQNLLDNVVKNKDNPKLSLNDIGFEKANQKIVDFHLDSHLIKNYESTRNFPAKDATSKLGPHLRFGTISIREVIKKASKEANQTFFQELIWREFFMQILWHYPYTENQSFKPKYDRIEWRNNEKEFKAWCAGETGYPLVDAGMRQLNKTGFMHNRVRMLVGSFLCKHLLIDWRWGEAYFAEKLHDYEMASNLGNWQWVAGCGVDASPYFRIFNPTTQIQKFDKNLDYIKKWITDFQELSYPTPIIDHPFARERCLKTYKMALQ